MARPGTKGIQMKRIVGNLWFNEGADEAVELYTSLFEDSAVGQRLSYTEAGREIHGREPGSTMTIDFSLAGCDLVILNGGPYVQLNPSASLAVGCTSPQEVDRLWEALSPGGKTLMELDEYAWAPRYGWLQDRFGLSWQISYAGGDAPEKTTVNPSLLFVGDAYGKAREAMEFWTSVIEDSRIERAEPRPEDPDAVLWAQFVLAGNVYTAMESDLEHDFEFNEAFSLMIECENQDEVDSFWELLGEGGKRGPCGWLKDRFGVSWQVVPIALNQMMRDGDPEQVRRVTDCFMKMEKLDIAELEAVYSGG